MIRTIPTIDFKTAEAILSVSIPAYQVEAKIIGFDAIPALKATPETIMSSKDIYIGYYEQEKLVAVLSYIEEENFIYIHSLVVHPDHFRKGYATQLLHFLFQQTEESIEIHTGKNNVPAITLYTKLGFKIVREIEVAPSIYLSVLQKGKSFAPF